MYQETGWCLIWITHPLMLLFRPLLIKFHHFRRRHSNVFPIESAPFVEHIRRQYGRRHIASSAYNDGEY